MTAKHRPAWANMARPPCCVTVANASTPGVGYSAVFTVAPGDSIGSTYQLIRAS